MASVNMKKSTERVVRMKQDFMRLHEEGKTIPEIAKIHHLDFSTVYKYLQEIADENGTTREKLLSRVYDRKISNSKNYSTPKTPNTIDFKKLSKSFDFVLTELNNLITDIDCISKTIAEDTEE